MIIKNVTLIKNKFSSILLEWSVENPRDLPWTGERNPYFIWLSEIILQQTRVAQGLPYYLNFTTAYPTVTELANAPLDDVLRLWQGLGYYSRARNMHAAAQYISNDLNACFPISYEELKKIKGVGEYTAAAIASFAYNLNHAVVDGNVYRVLARVFGIETAIDSSEGKNEFSALAAALLPEGRAADYNQAIMNFGATVCTPKKPKCDICVFKAYCAAYSDNSIDLLPYKAKKMTKKQRFFHFFVLAHEEEIWIQQRVEKDIWQGLHHFPLIETPDNTSRIEDAPEFSAFFDNHIPSLHYLTEARQTLTHQIIIAKFYLVENGFFVNFKNKNHFFRILPKDIPNFALPKIMVSFLETGLFPLV